jgi:hypothetical protein
VCTWGEISQRRAGGVDFIGKYPEMSGHEAAIFPVFQSQFRQ